MGAQAGRAETEINFPDTVIGRETELRYLEEKYRKVLQGKSEAVFIRGFAGSGKTALVEAFGKSIGPAGVLFLSGKYDQYQGDPFWAFRSALNQLASHVLMLEPCEYKQRRAQIIETVSPYEDILIRFAPKWDRIIEAGERTDLSFGERRNVLVTLITALIDLFATEKRPLLLFLDDLQWIDEGSRFILGEILGLKKPRHFFLIGAYREEEFDENDFAWCSLVEDTVSIPPLSREVIARFLLLTFPPGMADVSGLAEILRYTTGGNPLRLKELIKDILHHKGLVYSDGEWGWDEAVLRITCPGNEDPDFSRRYQSISADVRELLVIAAALGGDFSISEAAVAFQKEEKSIHRLILHAREEGLVIPAGEEGRYRFAHDIIRSSFYNFVPPEQRPRFHLKIARRFESASLTFTQENNFEIVNHYNRAAGVLETQADAVKLLRLNLTAAKTALNGTAWEQAYAYAAAGIEVMPKNFFRSDYLLAMDLLNTGIQAAFLSGNYESMERWIGAVESNAEGNIDRAFAWKVRVQSLVARRKLSESLEKALDYTSRLGLTVRTNPLVVGIKWNPLRRRIFYIRAVRNGEKMRSRSSAVSRKPARKAAFDILPVITSSSYLIDQTLFTSIAMNIFRRTLRESSGRRIFPFICFGYVLVMKGRYRQGVEVAEVGLEMIHKTNSPAQRTKAYMYHGILIEHWRNHLRSSVEILRKGAAAAEVSGEYEFGSYCWTVLTFYRVLLAENPLSELEKELLEAAERVRHMKQERNIAVVVAHIQWVRGLMGKTADTINLDGSRFSEKAHIERTENSGDKSHLATYFTGKIFTAYLFHDYAAAADFSGRTERIIHHITGQGHYPIYFYLSGLTYFNLAGSAGKYSKRRRYVRRAKRFLRKVKHFARAIPINHEHRYLFMLAELDRLRGRKVTALERYAAAEQAAYENGSLYDRGMILEHTGTLLREMGMKPGYREYILRAHRCFERWNAWAKVDQLMNDYPDVFTDEKEDSSDTVKSVGLEKNSHIDSFLRTSRAVSSEPLVDNILSCFMNSVILSLGADKGCLLEYEDGLLTPRSVAGCAEGELSYSSGLVNYAFRSGEIVVYDVSSFPRIVIEPEIAGEITGWIICLPVRIHGQIHAVVYLEGSGDSREISEGALEMVESMAPQAVLSMESSRMHARERELQEMNKDNLLRVLKADKLASLGFLVAEIAHEVNNPNQAIRLNADNLLESAHALLTVLDEYEDKDELCINGLAYTDFREDLPLMIRTIRSAAVHIERLVGELKEFMKPKQKRELVSVDINRVLEATILIASHFIKKSTGAFSWSRRELPRVWGDFQKLQQVFLNLLRNGCQAAEETAGDVLIETGYREVDGSVSVCVIDEGPGIDPDLLEEIEKPFFSTRQKESGLGLGLYVCKTIIHEHGGELRFESSPGAGTRATVFLSAADEDLSTTVCLDEIIED